MLPTLFCLNPSRVILDKGLILISNKRYDLSSIEKKKTKRIQTLKRIARGKKQDHGTKSTIRGHGRERHNTEEWKLSRRRRRDFRRGAAEE